MSHPPAAFEQNILPIRMKNIQIKPTVLVIIAPHCAGTIAVGSNARRVGNVGKCPVTVVLKECVDTVTGNVEIKMPIVVQIAPGC